MRESFSGLSTGDPEYVEMLTAPEDPLQRPPLMLDHVYHCYDYLRQSILCQADLTLEWASYVNTSHIDGYGPPHQCRNWVSLSVQFYLASNLTFCARMMSTSGWWTAFLRIRNINSINERRVIMVALSVHLSVAFSARAASHPKHSAKSNKSEFMCYTHPFTHYYIAHST